MFGTEGDNDPEQEPEEGRNPAADKARRIILARRARFVAMAVAGIGVAAACGDSDGDTGPEVCLSIAAGGPSQFPPDAGGTGGNDAATDAADDADSAR
jgi:hypothetical protein